MTSPKIGPFYTSAMNFYSDSCAARGDYTCIVCQIGTTQADAVAISYASGRATFSHAACLTSAGIPISDDTKAKARARAKIAADAKAVKEAEKLLKRVNTAQAAPAPIAGGEPTPDETVPVDEAALREQIEAEYDELLGQAIDRLKTMGALIESLQAENRRLVAQNAVAALAPASAPPAATEAAPEAAPATTEAVSVTQDQKDKHLCRVCSKPARKNADTCKLHQFAAPVATPTPAEPVAVRPQTGSYIVTFVGMAPNDTMVRLHQSGVMQNPYDGPCSYLMLNADVVREFKTLAPGTKVRVYLDDKKVSAVMALEASEAA